LEDLNYIKLYKETKDLKQLESLFLKYKNLVYGVGLKYFSNAESAKDLTNDIFILLSRKVLDHEIDNFKPWLYTLTKNYCLDRLRSNKSKIPKETEAQFMYYEQLLHLDDVVDENLKMELNNCMDQLSDVQLSAVKLFYYERKSYQLISEILQIEWGSVRSLIQNGRRNLKICLQKKGFNEGY
jgi:RNA polymerase sigma-70 factor (ECF subfamily)